MDFPIRGKNKKQKKEVSENRNDKREKNYEITDITIFIPSFPRRRNEPVVWVWVGWWCMNLRTCTGGTQDAEYGDSMVGTLDVLSK